MKRENGALIETERRRADNQHVIDDDGPNTGAKRQRCNSPAQAVIGRVQQLEGGKAGRTHETDSRSMLERHAVDVIVGVVAARAGERSGSWRTDEAVGGGVEDLRSGGTGGEKHQVVARRKRNDRDWRERQDPHSPYVR